MKKYLTALFFLLLFINALNFNTQKAKNELFAKIKLRKAEEALEKVKKERAELDEILIPVNKKDMYLALVNRNKALAASGQIIHEVYDTEKKKYRSFECSGGFYKKKEKISIIF